MNILVRRSLVIASAAALLVGCSSTPDASAPLPAPDAAQEAGSDGDDTTTSQRVTLSDEETTVEMFHGAEVPEEWPSDIALPSGFSVNNAQALSESGHMVSVSGTVADLTPEEVVDHFAAQLTGWTSTSVGSGEVDGELREIHVFTTDDRSLDLAAIQVPGEATTLSLNHMQSGAVPADDATTDDEAPLLQPDGDGGVELGDDAQSAVDALGLDSLISAWESTIPNVDRIEVVGDEVHVFLDSEASESSPLITCMVIGGTGSERASAFLVHHPGGTDEC